MQDQVENILKISQLERDKNISDMRNENLHSIISNAINHFSLIVKSKKGSIRTNLNAENTICSIVKIDFTNALINIIDNGIKYGEKVNIELIKSSNNLFIKIEDDGPGIDEKEYDNVFKPFYKIDKGRADSKSSVGLGLSIASDIIRSHGGNIKLEKSNMNGLSVKIFLPV